MQSLIRRHRLQPRPTKPADDALKKCKSDRLEILFTSGTECAPEGSIFFDAYCGTISWEADIASKVVSSPELLPGTHNVSSGGEATSRPKK